MGSVWKTQEEINIDSVFRFIILDVSNIEKAKKIGEEINFLIPGAYDGIRKSGDGFSCSASDNEDWVEHQAEIVMFLRKIRNKIFSAKNSGINVVLDISVESNIKNLLRSYQFNEAFLRELVDSGVVLEISVYNVE